MANKVMIVFDAPMKCKDCKLYGEDGSAKYCKYNDRILQDPERPGHPYWCTLLPTPQKVDEGKAKDVIHQAGFIGWNQCVDFIEGKAYEQ